MKTTSSFTSTFLTLAITLASLLLTPVLLMLTSVGWSWHQRSRFARPVAPVGIPGGHPSNLLRRGRSPGPWVRRERGDGATADAKRALGELPGPPPASP